MSKKLTDKQKTRLWELQRSRNFQASSALDGLSVPLIELSHDKVEARVAALRAHYER